MGLPSSWSLPPSEVFLGPPRGEVFYSSQKESQMSLLGRRRRRDERRQNLVRRRFRMGIRHNLRQHGSRLNQNDFDNLSELLVDDDALDEVIDKAEAENPRLVRQAEEDDSPGRDWSGFFQALGELLMMLLPMIAQLFGLGGIPLPIGHTAQPVHVETFKAPRKAATRSRRK